MAGSIFKNWLVIVPCVDGIFFPLRELLGFHSRELTPKVIRKITILSGETRSYKRAVIALAEADVPVSTKTVERRTASSSLSRMSGRKAPTRSRC